jgi:hypothetical protein
LTELLSEQHLDIRLVIDNKHPDRHGTGPHDLAPHLGIGFVAMFPLAGQNRDLSVASGFRC